MKTLKFSAVLLLVISLAIVGCKKNPVEEIPDTSSMETLSQDENLIVQSSDGIMNDVCSFLSEGNFKSTNWWIPPCNATLDSVRVINDTLTFFITYDGLNCAGTRIRTGNIEIRKPVGVNWHEAGATVNVKIIDFTITKVGTPRTVTLNGTRTLENESGGVIWQLGNGIDYVVHQATGSMSAVFGNGTSRIWYFARQKLFTGTPGEFIVTVSGFGSANGYENLVVWGTNRNDEDFYTQIIQAVEFKQVCDWHPVSGIKVHQIPGDNYKSATITFGYDDNNQPVTGDECPTKFKLDWERNGNSGTIYLFL